MNITQKFLLNKRFDFMLGKITPKSARSTSFKCKSFNKQFVENSRMNMIKSRSPQISSHDYAKPKSYVDQEDLQIKNIQLQKEINELKLQITITKTQLKQQEDENYKIVNFYQVNDNFDEIEEQTLIQKQAYKINFKKAIFQEKNEKLKYKQLYEDLKKSYSSNRIRELDTQCKSLQDECIRLRQILNNKQEIIQKQRQQLEKQQQDDSDAHIDIEDFVMMKNRLQQALAEISKLKLTNRSNQNTIVETKRKTLILNSPKQNENSNIQIKINQISELQSYINSQDRKINQMIDDMSQKNDIIQGYKNANQEKVILEEQLRLEQSNLKAMRIKFLESQEKNSVLSNQLKTMNAKHMMSKLISSTLKHDKKQTQLISIQPNFEDRSEIMKVGKQLQYKLKNARIPFSEIFDHMPKPINGLYHYVDVYEAIRGHPFNIKDDTECDQITRYLMEDGDTDMATLKVIITGFYQFQQTVFDSVFKSYIKQYTLVDEEEIQLKRKKIGSLIISLKKIIEQQIIRQAKARMTSKKIGFTSDIIHLLSGQNSGLSKEEFEIFYLEMYKHFDNHSLRFDEPQFFELWQSYCNEKV